MPMPTRHIPYGPLPPSPASQQPLSPSSIRILLILLLRKEHLFLTNTLPTLYSAFTSGPAQPAANSNAGDDGDRSPNPLTLGNVMEIIFFMLGFKQIVLIGWGDGRDLSGDSRCSTAWISQVWNPIMTDLEIEIETKSKSKSTGSIGYQRDLRNLLHHMRSVKFRRLGPISGQDSIWTGHIILYKPPGSPCTKLLLNIPGGEAVLITVHEDQQQSSPTLSPTITNLSLTTPPPITNFNESFLAHILDYPIPLPRTMSHRNIMITYSLAFFDVSIMGTQYLVPPLGNLTNNLAPSSSNHRSTSDSSSPISPTPKRSSRKKVPPPPPPTHLTVKQTLLDHYLSYSSTLTPILAPLGMQLGISIEGLGWFWGKDMDRRKQLDLRGIGEVMGLSMGEVGLIGK